MVQEAHKKNIVILGFMGTGKSIIGRRLAVELRYHFIDTDKMIEDRTQKRVPEIFDESGEAYFRSMEAEIVKEVSELSHHVISTGGGVPINPENLDCLEQSGILVTLTARPEIILKRVQRRKGERPLLDDGNSLTTITRLLSERLPYYSRSIIAIDTSDIQIGESVRRLLKQITPHLQGIN